MLCHDLLRVYLFFNCVDRSRFKENSFDYLITVLRPAQTFFYLYGDVITAGEGLQN
jgi:hypothetical protein